MYDICSGILSTDVASFKRQYKKNTQSVENLFVDEMADLNSGQTRANKICYGEIYTNRF